MKKGNPRKCLCCLFLILLLVLPAAQGTPEIAARSPINIVVYDQTLYSDVPPIIVNDRTLVPMRAIFEALGAEVAWDPMAQEVTAQRGQDIVILQINNPLGVVNGTVVDLDAAPMIFQDRTMVPARFVAESLGEIVQWDPQSSTVYIGNSHIHDPGNSVLTEDQAITRVAAVAPPLPGVSLAVMFEDNRDGNAYYAVKAYETIFDGGGVSHTSALNWYYVDKSTGSVYVWDMIDDTLTLLD